MKHDSEGQQMFVFISKPYSTVLLQFILETP